MPAWGNQDGRGQALGNNGGNLCLEVSEERICVVVANGLNAELSLQSGHGNNECMASRVLAEPMYQVVIQSFELRSREGQLRDSREPLPRCFEYLVRPDEVRGHRDGKFRLL